MLTADKVKPRSSGKESLFARTRRAEIAYARQLRKAARHVGEIIRAFAPGDPAVIPELQRTLQNYAGVLVPWANATASRMLAEVQQRDENAWAQLGRAMSRALRREIREAPTGQILRVLLDEQIGLITSLPIEAGERVHQLTQEMLITGRRADEIVPEILRSGDVTVARANLIARTETARTASSLTQARAVYIGSEGYTWRTAHDRDVRRGHRAMEGKFCRWDDPPEVDEGHMTGRGWVPRLMRHHAGAIWNCRCYPQPLIPETFDD